MTDAFVGILLIIASILWIWALIDIAKRYRKSDLRFTKWILVIVIFPILGSLLYFQKRKRKRVFQPDFNRSIKV